MVIGQSTFLSELLVIFIYKVLLKARYMVISAEYLAILVFFCGLLDSLRSYNDVC